MSRTSPYIFILNAHLNIYNAHNVRGICMQDVSKLSTISNFMPFFKFASKVLSHMIMKTH